MQNTVEQITREEGACSCCGRSIKNCVWIICGDATFSVPFGTNCAKKMLSVYEVKPVKRFMAYCQVHAEMLRKGKTKESIRSFTSRTSGEKLFYVA